MKIVSKNLGETNKIAEDFSNKIKNPLGRPQGEEASATVVGLFGDLGSGKTTFTQALGKILGVKEVMTSPTFVIEKRYDLDGRFGFKRLVHIDAYRLEKGKELLSLNFIEDTTNSENLILIEWPERVGDVLPADLVPINFKFISEFDREIEY